MAAIALRSPFNRPPPAAAMHAAPSGTFLPGTKVQVGSHRVVVEKYLSEGGYAHVYVVRPPEPIDNHELAVLKRVAVPDKGELSNMRTEVETMKRLRGQKYIVKYIDSHASQLKGSGYEVFLLMEYCAGGGLIDFMNTRLQNRLTEPEILRIFTDVTLGVASMHYLKPPLMHRDIKVENVLISQSGSSRIFKLCDFGSTAPARPAATTAAEARVIEDDIQRHTTLQYRSPEMVDVYRKHPIDEKSDIWALGVFLYKLCYYTTPFEEVGQMAILNARFKYPAYPQFSDALKLLIATMLRENPSKRPNVYQVLKQVCQIQGKDVPIRDIYVERSHSESRKSQQLPNPSSSQSRAGATLSPTPKPQQANIPDITPMRRGRPEKPVSHHNSAKPSPSPLRMIDNSDPFATLDGGASVSGDELSSRFPTLDQFSLLTDSGHKFDFDSSKPTQKADDLSTRITHALADEAFVRSSSPPKSKSTSDLAATAIVSRPSLEPTKSREAQDPTQITRGQGPSVPIKSATVSDRAAPPSKQASSMSQALSRSIYKVSGADRPARSSSLPQAAEKSHTGAAGMKSRSNLANLLHEDALQSQLAFKLEPRSPTSSRPSLEGGRPSMKDLDADLGLSRSRSLNLRPRPVSVNVTDRPTHVNDRKINKIQYGSSAEKDRSIVENVDCDVNINSDIEFLKAKEEEERQRHKHHRRLGSGSKHLKRSSLPSVAVIGTRNLLTGRFGDVFRKFEHNQQNSSIPRTPSPSREPFNVLTPIAGSEATDLSDDRFMSEETDDLSPEMRREIEKRKLDAEERRVEAATAEYRRRVNQRGGGGGSSSPYNATKATSMQNRGQSLLKENDRPATRTAEGYGRFTNATAIPSLQHAATDPVSEQDNSKSLPQITHQSAVITIPSGAPQRSSTQPLAQPQPQQQPQPRPQAPPKPQILRTGGGRPSATAASTAQPASPNSNDDWEAQFSKRYPSLSGLEMVETEIKAGGTTGGKTAGVVRVKEI